MRRPHQPMTDNEILAATIAFSNMCIEYDNPIKQLEAAVVQYNQWHDWYLVSPVHKRAQFSKHYAISNPTNVPLFKNLFGVSQCAVSIAVILKRNIIIITSKTLKKR